MSQSTDAPTFAQDEANACPAPAADSQEVARLQAALSGTLAQLHHLQAENEALEKRLARGLPAAASAILSDSEIRQLRQQKNAADRQCRQLQYRLEVLERKYDALSRSKLGRLTLHYWAYQKERGGGRLLCAILFLFRWLFNRLPAPPVSGSEEIAGSEERAGTAGTKEPAVKANLPVPQAPKEPDTVMTEAQEQWVQPYLERIGAMEESNGCRYYERLPLRMGIVCDEFFYDSMKDAADFVYLTPDNWRGELEQGLDGLLFVSTWRGLDMEWRGLSSANLLQFGLADPRQESAFALLDACRERNVPTIFYSKEDPGNYELFVEFAKRCRYVFTSAKECIPYYQADCGREDVEAICFGINPMEHNPIGSHSPNKEDTILFSGSWTMKYPDRCAELSMIFDGILETRHGLHIIDRNYPDNPRHHFPEPYFAHSSPALPHGELQKLHKLFDWAVNINSAKVSETMFANRAVELQASGILMLSNFSVGVNNLHPLVQIVQDSGEVAPILDAMTPEERYERQMAGVRAVMTGHTCFDRMAQLLAPTGLPTAQPVRRVLVLAESLTDRVRKSFALQSYPEKTLLPAEEATEEVLAGFDMVTWFAPEARYGAFYLEDLVNGFKYTACDYITKDAYLEGGTLHPGTEHGYVGRMGSKCRTLFWCSAYAPGFLLGLGEEPADLPNGYSIDHLSYDACPTEREHTPTDWRLSVVMPVYNNGRHLYGKGFASLRRSSVFADMEILLVDDGSTDPLTLLIEEDLVESYPNVRLYRFEAGGSGSASRARNKGVELATAPYVAFLDPDNEAVNDGYARLLGLAEAEQRDLAAGNLYETVLNPTLVDCYTPIVQAAGADTFDEGFGTTLQDTGFRCAGLQAMVIRTQLIRDNCLEQVPGAVGQDALFSRQLFSCARRIRMLDLPVCICYGGVTGSVTGENGPAYFRKVLLLQQPMARWLESAGLMEAFMAGPYQEEITHGLLPRLAAAEDGPACVKTAEEILKVFAPYYPGGDPLIDGFVSLCGDGDYDGAMALLGKTFPREKRRPLMMLTVDELCGRAGKPLMQVTCRQEGTNVSFVNESGADTYAWVILPAVGKYQKLYGSKYTADPRFTYDFSSMEPGAYKVRAFLRRGGEKDSDDVAAVRVGEDHTVVLLSRGRK